MNLYSCAFRNDEIELLRTGEIANARVRYIGRLVRRHHIVPYTHLSLSLYIYISLALEISPPRLLLILLLPPLQSKTLTEFLPTLSLTDILLDV